MKKLINFVTKYTKRGDCQCGECIVNSVNEKPIGHTIDLTFFKIGIENDPNINEFKKLTEDAGLMPTEKEDNYINVGAKIGSQDLAFRFMALGHLLGIWKVLGPEQLMPFLSFDMKMKMAQSGLITYKK